jgi:hypothetical protein
MNPHLRMRLAICMLLSLATAYFSLSAQSKKVSFNTSAVVPDAEGTVKVKKDKNGNYHISVDIVNLADSKKLTPPKNAYVVWLDAQEKGAKNIGQIHSSSSMFSKTKKASISTVSAYKPVRIYATAADDPGVEQPGEVVVLTTNSF